jgi:hypothetical protein
MRASIREGREGFAKDAKKNEMDVLRDLRVTLVFLSRTDVRSRIQFALPLGTHDLQ